MPSQDVMLQRQSTVDFRNVPILTNIEHSLGRLFLLVGRKKYARR